MGRGHQGEWGEEESRDLIDIRGQVERKLTGNKKGKGTSDPESGRQRQCPFFDELHEVFTERAKTVQSQSRLSDDNDEDDDDDPSGVNRITCRKRKAERDVPEMLKEFLDEQQRMEMEWRKMMERHAYERRLFEQEWRLSMEKRQRERLIAHRTWMEAEEQIRIKEESRAQTRHELLTTLFTQLLNDDHL